MSHDFVFVSRKFVSNMKDFTPSERSKWLMYLQYSDTQLERKTSDDFFNEKYKDCSGYTDEVWIDIWQYDEIIIQDMYGWQNITQFGVIFIENSWEILSMNTNGTLVWEEENLLTGTCFQHTRSLLMDEYLKIYQEHKKEKDISNTISPQIYLPVDPSFSPERSQYPLPGLISLPHARQDYDNKYTEEQIQQFIQDDKEQCERERTFLHEFNLKDCKFATQMSDLTEIEVRLWKEFLRRDNLIHDGIVDLFDKTEYWDGYNEDIRVMYFEWIHNGKVNLLLDMNAWPGDNESGAIFLGEEMVYHNGDQDITALETASKELRDRVDTYRHIRIQSCVDEPDYDDYHEIHKHCQQINDKYKIIEKKHYEQLNKKYESTNLQTLVSVFPNKSWNWDNISNASNIISSHPSHNWS